MSDVRIPSSGSGQPLPGVTVAVLRNALDLMEVQGEAVMNMIDSAAAVTALATRSTPGAIVISDPLIAQQVDVLV